MAFCEKKLNLRVKLQIFLVLILLLYASKWENTLFNQYVVGMGHMFSNLQKQCQSLKISRGSSSSIIWSSSTTALGKNEPQEGDLGKAITLTYFTKWPMPRYEQNIYTSSMHTLFFVGKECVSHKTRSPPFIAQVQQFHSWKISWGSSISIKCHPLLLLAKVDPEKAT